MGNFSRDTFDKLKHYVSVRLQQGVPLVDADWNEQDDIRKYELQAFLKWFVGNGVPEGNDGFRIEAIAGSVNDFTIKGGDGTAEGAGRCIVEGWDVLIESSITYRGQPLHVSQPRAAELAAAWGVDTLPELSAPTDRTDLVYLDVWEREVDAREDGNLVNSAIGLETCVRLRREWVVRVEENSTVPPATPTGHNFYPLALIRRQAGQAEILPEDISDQRLTGLKMASQNDIRQVVTDAYGSSYTLDHDGQPNLQVSLRDAINALLRRELPSTSETQLTFDINFDLLPIALEDSQGDIWVFWQSTRNLSAEIWYNRYMKASKRWEGDTKATSVLSPSFPISPCSVLQDSNGNIWVFWSPFMDGKYKIWYNQFTNGRWVGDDDFKTGNANDWAPYALIDSNDDIWVFWFSDTDIWYRRYTNGSWLDSKPLTAQHAINRSPYPIVDKNGNIWVFWISNRSGKDNVWYKRFTNGSWEPESSRLTLEEDIHKDLCAIVDSNGDIWVFWISNRSGKDNVWYKRFINGSWLVFETELTSVTEKKAPFALIDTHGDLLVFWETKDFPLSNYYYNRFNPHTGWGHSVQLSTVPARYGARCVLGDSHGDIWVFWNRTMGPEFSDFNIFYKKLIPVI